MTTSACVIKNQKSDIMTQRRIQYSSCLFVCNASWLFFYSVRRMQNTNCQNFSTPPSHIIIACKTLQCWQCWAIDSWHSLKSLIIFSLTAPFIPVKSSTLFIKKVRTIKLFQKVPVCRNWKSLVLIYILSTCLYQHTHMCMLMNAHRYILIASVIQLLTYQQHDKDSLKQSCNPGGMPHTSVMIEGINHRLLLPAGIFHCWALSVEIGIGTVGTIDRLLLCCSNTRIHSIILWSLY